MSVSSYDELNIRSNNRRIEPYKEYFDKMSITYFHRKEKNNGNCIKYSDC